MSRMARSAGVCSRAESASCPSAASATTCRSGSASRIIRSPLRTSAWSSASSIRAGYEHQSAPPARGMTNRTSVPSPCGERSSDRRSTSSARSRMPLMPAPSPTTPAAPVVGDAQRELIGGDVQVEPNLRRLARAARRSSGSPALCGSRPVRHRSRARSDCGAMCLTTTMPLRLGELAAQCVERAVQSEVFQCIWPQPARDAAHFVEAGAHRLLRVRELAADFRWCAVDGAFEHQ